MTFEPNAHIRVVLVDDHVVVRAGLRMLIESQRGLEVAGEAGSSAEALAIVESVRPDVILLDVDLGGENGLDLLPMFMSTVPGTRVMILTGIRDSEVHTRAVRLGARGLVLKNIAADTLIKAIHKVYAGEMWLDRSLTATVLTSLLQAAEGKGRSPEAASIALLTERELEIVGLIGEGLKNRHIGERLFISETTVRHHLTSIFSKLGVSDRLELVIFGYKHGLAKLPA
jgi:DNA-binding NarL/FixJ family response regulator